MFPGIQSLQLASLDLAAWKMTSSTGRTPLGFRMMSPLSVFIMCTLCGGFKYCHIDSCTAEMSSLALARLCVYTFFCFFFLFSFAQFPALTGQMASGSFRKPGAVKK